MQVKLLLKGCLFSCLNLSWIKLNCDLNESWAFCVLQIEFRRYLLFLWYNLWLYRDKITCVPALQNLGQRFTILDIEVCSCDYCFYGNVLIFSNLMTSDPNSTWLKLGSWHSLPTTNLFKCPILINNPLYHQIVWTS